MVRIDFTQREHEAIKRMTRIRTRDPDLPQKVPDKPKTEPSLAKMFISGTTVETYEFQSPIYYRAEGQKGWWGGRGSGGTGGKDRTAESRKLTTNRGRNKLRRIINNNFDAATSKFITLTFSPRQVIHTRDGRTFNFKHWENINHNSPKECKPLFTDFCRRMRDKYGRFKWAVVIEFQERGAVHYHMVVDIGDLNHDDTFSTDIWGHGFTLVTPIDCVDNVGSYVTSYMTKDFEDSDMLEGTKMYETSRGNLLKPIEITGMEVEQQVKEWAENEKNTLVYEREYPAEFVEHIRYREYNIGRGDRQVRKSAELKRELMEALAKLY